MQQFIFKAALEDLVYELELPNSKVHYNLEPSMKYLTSCYMNVISRIFMYNYVDITSEICNTIVRAFQQ